MTLVITLEPVTAVATYWLLPEMRRLRALRLADPFDILQLIINQSAFGSGNFGHRFEMQLAGTTGNGHGLDGLAAKINTRQRKQRTFVE